tara:strand:+ start:204 stop:821 length:618 start_codon:yes stop_codon:yes gene_type:complete
MALNKKKISKKNIIQLSLLFAGLFLIFITYFSSPKKIETTPELAKTQKSEKEISQDENQEGINRFEDVEYRGVDINGNRYVIGSKYANFTTERPEIINMTQILCTFYFKDGTNLVIVSDLGTYNNTTNDMEFKENVKMNYLKNILFAESANFMNVKNELRVEGNVITEGPQGELQADKLDFDLSTKKLKISMYNDEKVNIKVNLQ